MSHISFGRELASVLLKVFGVILTLVLIVAMVGVFSFSFSSISDGTCNIAVIPIDGIIMPFGHGYEFAEFTTTPSDVRDFLALAEADLFIEGIMFEINSPGGTPVAAADIMEQIQALELPNVSLVGDIAASGGYMVASAADRVLASAMSDVGSIGVTMSYVEESEKNKEEGLTYVPLNSGKYKDIGSPNKPLSAEERAYLESEIKLVHEEFIKIVATNRNLSTEAVTKLADGSSMVGSRALENKLVDEIGNRNSVRQYFADTLGKDSKDISFCEYVTPIPYL